MILLNWYIVIKISSLEFDDSNRCLKANHTIINTLIEILFLFDIWLSFRCECFRF